MGMCTAPQNNPIITENQKYAGVGGHLFAIAAERSLSLGFGGAITGNAANMELVEHYCSILEQFILVYFIRFNSLLMKIMQNKLRRHMIMSGQTMNYKKYYNHLKKMPEPVMPSELPKKKFDLRKAAQYIKEHNLSVTTMTESEKEVLLKKVQ